MRERATKQQMDTPLGVAHERKGHFPAFLRTPTERHVSLPFPSPFATCWIACSVQQHLSLLRTRWCTRCGFVVSTTRTHESALSLLHENSCGRLAHVAAAHSFRQSAAFQPTRALVPCGRYCGLQQKSTRLRMPRCRVTSSWCAPVSCARVAMDSLQCCLLDAV